MCTGPLFVFDDIGEEEKLQFTHSGINVGINDILVGLGYTVDPPPHQGKAWGKYKLQNGIFCVIILPACGGNIGVDG